MSNTKVAADFEKIINDGRERKKNEALAARIFNKDRRAESPRLKPVAGGSLASRVGVKKRVGSARNSPSIASPSGDINGEWTHDLHDRHARSAPSSPAPGSLASRISNPALAQNVKQRQQRRAAQVAQALNRTELQPANPPTSAGPNARKGLTIRGLAGPYVVMAQNFAPGTTAADIESAMTPVGGLVSSCRILKTSPIVIAEIVFESREGAEEVIATFNNQTADGRLLHVYHKASGLGPAPQRNPQPAKAPPTGPRADRDNMVVDGTMGFDDPMETESGNSNGLGGRQQQNYRGQNGGLYSDSVMRTERRGRGFDRGGRSGSGR